MLRVALFLFAVAAASGSVVRNNFKSHVGSRTVDGECPPYNDDTYPTYLGDTEDCTIFYTCDWGRPIPQPCPPGTSWSSAHRCDTSEVDQCEGAKSGKKLHVKPLSAVGKCPNPSGEFPEYLPDDEDCSIFYECANGVAIKLQCAPGDLFDSVELKCVKAVDAHCYNSSKKAKQIHPYSPNGQCPSHQGENPVYLPDTEDCTVFYECDAEGTPVPKQCESGTVFNPTLSVCDRPENVNCPSGSRRVRLFPINKKISLIRSRSAIAKKHIQPSSIVGECPSQDGEYPVYLPDDEDCSAFYECSHGVPNKLHCAPGSLFDSISNKCVDASEATCQKPSK